jgi:hypothetical protein
VNSATRGHGNYRGSGGGGRGGFGHGFGHRGGENGSSSGPKLVHHLCKKTGHTVLRCWKRFDKNFSSEEKAVNTAEGPAYNIDTAWYLDIGAIDHITSELDKLTVREKYTGQEQIHAVNGGRMWITHVGEYTLFTPHRNLSLKNVLHVPSSQRNLVFIHRFTRDNHVFVEYHPYIFLVKDPLTGNMLLRDRCKGALYPFPSLEKSTTKCALSTVQPSINCWHECLGHPSMVVIHRVLDDNKLAFSKELVLAVVCDACQCAKSHQLPFPKSHSVSKAPLELVFFDVWGLRHVLLVVTIIM